MDRLKPDNLSPEERLKLYHEKAHKKQRKQLLIALPVTAVVIAALVLSLAAVPGTGSAQAAAGTVNKERSESSDTGTAQLAKEDGNTTGAGQSSQPEESPAEGSDADSSGANAEKEESSTGALETLETSDTSSKPAEESSKEARESSAAEESLEPAQPPVVPDGYSLAEFTADDVHTGVLQLVNKDHAYTFKDNWETTNMYDMAVASGSAYGAAYNDIVLQSTAAESMDRMLKACRDATGSNDVELLNGYRSQEEARSLYDEDKAKNGQDHADMYIMQPGYSEHHTSLASDLGQTSTGSFLGQDASDPATWLMENSYNYGYILRYPADKTEITKIGYETWHYRYVGLAVAKCMHDNNFCYEEFIDYIKNYSAASPLTIDSVYGTYTMYYQRGTKVPVPGRDYWISGNNVDGFIVWFLDTP